MSKKQKKILWRIIISAILLVGALLLPTKGILRLITFLIPYLIIGYDVIWDAVRGILGGQLLDENFLMVIASVGAIVIGEYPECVAVMLFYQAGELFQSIAVGRSRRSIAELMEIRPDSASVERDGEIVEVDPEEVRIGETLVIRPGDKIPLDSVVIEGSSSLNTVALTGEALPKDVVPGDSLVSGCINLNGMLKARVTHLYEDSTVAKILELVENSTENKSRRESFITRFARWYTPIVVGCAVLLAILPPLLFGQNWSDWFKTALIFLVVSCPCALVISVPLSFFAGIGGASRKGILIKGSNYLEALSECDTAVFDKTGTLTNGTFTVTKICPAEGFSATEIVDYAAAAESFSSHPIAKSLMAASSKTIDENLIESASEMMGHGVRTKIGEKMIFCGNDKYMAHIGCKFRPAEEIGTIVHVCIDETYAGYIVISDTVKDKAKEAIEELRRSGITHTVMLTGDRSAAAKSVAETLGLEEYHAELMPGDKVDIIRELIRKDEKKVLFVGDGINDAPVLARSDVGIAMGKLGTDAAIEAADVVIMDDNPAKIALAMKISRKTLRIVKQNIVFALGVKFLVMILSVLGYSNMWAAVAADVGVAVIAILNAMRAYRA